MAKTTRMKGPELFFNYYNNLFGSRWEELAIALLKENHYGCLTGNLLSRYYLDLASVITAWTLDVIPGHKVLDLCAAPGGKSLVIMRNLFPQWFSLEELVSLEQSLHNDLDIIEGNSLIFSRTIKEKVELTQTSPLGSLRLNERSSSRKERLKHNIANHSHPEMLIEFTGYDAAKYGIHMKGMFDRVLADVPCSSEQHLLQEPKYLKDWSPARTKNLGIQAGAIAIAGFDCLKPWGRMVYSTCALSPTENEEVIKKVIHKRPRAKTIPLTRVPEGIEDKNPGYIILPDRCNGLGPMYFCILEKEGSS